MSQSSILKLIEMSKKPLTVPEIMKKTGLAQSSVGHALFKLTKHGEVKRLAIKKGNVMLFIYWTKNTPESIKTTIKGMVEKR